MDIEGRSSTMDDSSSLYHDGKPFRDEPSSDLRLQTSSSSLEGSDGSSRSDCEVIELAYRKGRLPTFLESKWQPGHATNKWWIGGCSTPSSWGIRRRRVCLYGSILAVLVILIVAITVPVAENKKNLSLSTQESLTNNDGNKRETLAPTKTQDIFSSPSSDVVYTGMPDSPFSMLDPVVDLNLYPFDRPVESSPSPRLDPLRANTNNAALPTNSWYQNLLRLGADETPNSDHKAYTIPYVIDTAGAIPGVRIHNSRLVSTSTQVTLTIDVPFGLTLGGMSPNSLNATNMTGYTVHHATDLGINLKWDAFDNVMSSTLVEGMPYVTMIYDTTASSSVSVLPTIYSELDVEEVILDDVTTFDCDVDAEFRVEQELQLKFLGSGQRWLIFFSRPVEMQCQRGSPTILQVIGDGLERSASTAPLIVRAALVVSSSDTSVDSDVFEADYMDLLRAHADIFPGEATRVSFSFNSDQPEPDRTRIHFDWDARSMQNGGAAVVEESADEMMITFALPHHQDLLAATSTSVLSDMCTPSMTGSVCLTKGTVWNLDEQLPPVDLRAPRPPDAAYISVLAEALMDDIAYQIPENFQIGAADTYFSAKTIAKLGRILLINEEVRELCSTDGSSQNGDAYTAACEGLALPSDDDVDLALGQLRQTMTVWVKDNQQAPFVYDSAWGGVVSCGCLYDGGLCTNQFPDCPAFTDPGLNFGNGFYNDHHFHYGYFVYAAAVLAHFDPSWGMEHFEDVLLLIRDFANPSDQDKAFPTYRNKDWYRGHSWASGFSADPMFPNIMNQESLSEAIASFESVALFGKVMTSIYEGEGMADEAVVASMIHKTGLVLTATEIRSTQKYWHVVHGDGNVYPETYEHSVVGIVWSTMIIFTTWFGNDPFLIYGIQLLPLTPIAEYRDDVTWAKKIYPTLAASCDQRCVSEGWSVQIFGILATIGQVDNAVNATLNLPSTAYASAGGNGHSKSNTLWYISTRPAIDDPYLDESLEFAEVPELTCQQPSTCTGEYLSSMAGEYSCRSRIEYLMNYQALSEIEACTKIAVVEYPAYCSLCDPSGAVAAGDDGTDQDGPDDDTVRGGTTDDGRGVDIIEGELTCSKPSNCTTSVLDSLAGEFSCRDRIQYLIDYQGQTEENACQQIAVHEFPEVCGPCNPNL